MPVSILYMPSGGCPNCRTKNSNIMTRIIPDYIPRGGLFHRAVLNAETDKLLIQWRSQGRHGCMSPRRSWNFFQSTLFFAVSNFNVFYSVVYSMCLRLLGASPPHHHRGSAPSVPRNPSFVSPYSKFLAMPIRIARFFVLFAEVSCS